MTPGNRINCLKLQFLSATYIKSSVQTIVSSLQGQLQLHPATITTMLERTNKDSLVPVVESNGKEKDCTTTMNAMAASSVTSTSMRSPPYFNSHSHHHGDPLLTPFTTNATNDDAAVDVNLHHHRHFLVSPPPFKHPKNKTYHHCCCSLEVTEQELQWNQHIMMPLLDNAVVFSDDHDSIATTTVIESRLNRGPPRTRLPPRKRLCRQGQQQSEQQSEQRQQQ